VAEVAELHAAGPGVGLRDDEVVRFVREQLDRLDLDGRSVCLVLPDATRTCPLPLLLGAVHAALAHRVSRMTALIALGTHAPMTAEQLASHLHRPGGDLGSAYPGLHVVNHEWWDPGSLVSLGTIGSARVHELSEGRLDQPVEVRVNRHVVEHDVALVVGPVFPHEVVGFSGGNKYFFPGVAGPEVIDLSHWLGALISSAEIIGTLGTTPVRALIDEAASMIPAERQALCLVVTSGPALHSLAFGSPEAAWAACASVSARTHVRYLEHPVQRVLSVVPAKYQDMWTAAKGFYKVEPVVADGGQVVLLAPHITQISAVHPEIREIGYHCREYFTAQWERFAHHPWGVLAHSTHLRGAGSYDDQRGERCRVTVTLATGIPEEEVRAVGLDYLDPSLVDVARFGSDPGTLVVPDAGEVLFRLR
jgi:nickel-dependent lactate racemase